MCFGMASLCRISGIFGRTVATTSRRHFSQSLVKNNKSGLDRVWTLGKLNHVAIAVPNLDKAAALYRDVLGAKVSEPHAQPEHGVYTVFVELGDSKIELLHPLGKNSPIANFLEKNKSGGMHHICLEVSNIHDAIKEMKANNIRTLGSEPKIGAHGKLVMFLHPKDCNGTLIELEEA